MQFIHFTDLHFREKDAFQHELLAQLKADLIAERQKGLNPDYIVFSGDLVNNPDDENVYSLLESAFINPILEIFSLTQDNIVFCPGNHDVSWSDQRKIAPSYEWLMAKRNNQDFLDAESGKSNLMSYSRTICDGFFSLAKRRGSEWTSPFVRLWNFDETKTTFVAINTAFGCSLDGSAADRGKLCVSIGEILSVMTTVPAGNRVISFGHHTLSDMNEADHRSLSSIIGRYAIMHCFGHVHDPKPTFTIAPSGSCFLLQGGALYEKSNTYNGYSIVDISDEGNIRVRYRSYWKDRREFDEGTNVSKGGVVYDTEKSAKYWASVVPPPSEDDVRLYLLEAQEGVCKELQDTITDRKLSDTFVEPYIVKPAQGAEDDDYNLKSAVSLSSILKSEEHIVIASGREYGATSLLRRLVMGYYEECLNLERARVPVLIEAWRMRPYEANLTGLVRTGLPDTENRSLKPRSLADAGRLVILIDQFDPADEQHLASMKHLRQIYPKARVVCAAKLLVMSAEHILPVVGIEEFKFLQIRALNRGRIRQLVVKWMGANADVDSIVEEITSRFRLLGIPLTAPYVVIYLSIIQNDRRFNPLNASTVIENFIETVLEKYKPEYQFRGSFDYRDQLAYLSEIAEKMARSNKYVVPYNTIYEWTKDHFEAIGITQDYNKTIQFFHLNKIFDTEANCVLFKYNIFLSFFIANQMRLTRSFRDWIFSGEIYLRYVSEIEIYCGLTRNDVEAIDFLAAKFRDYDRQLATLVEPLAWEERLENVKLPKLQDGSTAAESITRQLTEPNLPDEKRDEALDRQDNHHPNNRPLIERPEVTGLINPWIVSLRAYSVALKNLEALPKSKKEDHLEHVLQGWATVLRYSCLLFETLIEQKYLEVGPLRFRLSIPDHIKAGMLRSLFTYIPVLVSQFVRKDLGSSKMVEQLRNDAIAKTMTTAFLQTSLYADMKLPEYVTQLKKLRTRVNNSELFLETMLMKMRDIYMRYNIAPLERRAFSELATDISTGYVDERIDKGGTHVCGTHGIVASSIALSKTLIDPADQVATTHIANEQP